MQFRPLLVAVSPLLVATSSLGAPLIDGLGGPAGFGDLVLMDGSATDDDGSSVAIDITAATGAGGLCYFDSDFTTLFVNNNGNVTFNEEVGTFTPDPFPIADQPMIAPFWADVETSDNLAEDPPLRNRVYFFQEPGRIIVTWHDVGYFNDKVDKLNDFQMEISNLRDKNNYDITYRYNRVDWTTGDASGGRGGLGGTPAQVGFDAGDGVRFVQLANSRSADIVNIDEQTNVDPAVPGLFTFQLRGCSLPVCGDGTIDPGEQCDDGNLRNGDGCNEFCVLDTDNDGLTDDEEALIDTDPENPDTDGDGFFDGSEAGSVVTPNDSDEDGTIDPLDPDSQSGGRSVFFVNSSDDTDDGSCDDLSAEGDCTLREAIRAAVASSDVVIRLDFSEPASIGISSLLALAGNNVTLEGPLDDAGAPLVTLVDAAEGSGAISVVAASSLRVAGIAFEQSSDQLVVSGTADVVIDGCSFVGGGDNTGLRINEQGGRVDGLLLNDLRFSGFVDHAAADVVADDIEVDGLVVEGSGFISEGEIPAMTLTASLRVFLNNAVFVNNISTGLRIASRLGRDLLVVGANNRFGVDVDDALAGNGGTGLDVAAGGRVSLADSIFAGNAAGGLAYGGNASLNRCSFDALLDGTTLVDPIDGSAEGEGEDQPISGNGLILNGCTVLGGRINASDITAVDTDFGIDADDVVIGYLADAFDQTSRLSLTRSRIAGAPNVAVFARFGETTLNDVTITASNTAVFAGGGEGAPSLDIDGLTVDGCNAALVVDDLDEEQSTLQNITVTDTPTAFDLRSSVALTDVSVDGGSSNVSDNVTCTRCQVQNTELGWSVSDAALVLNGATVDADNGVVGENATVIVDGDSVFVGGGSGNGIGIDVDGGRVSFFGSICGYGGAIVVNNGFADLISVGHDADGAACDNDVAVEVTGNSQLQLQGDSVGAFRLHDGSIFFNTAENPATIDGAVLAESLVLEGNPLELTAAGYAISDAIVNLPFAVLQSLDAAEDGVVVTNTQGLLPVIRVERPAGRCYVFDNYFPAVSIKGLPRLVDENADARLGEVIDQPARAVALEAGQATLTVDAVDCGGDGVAISGLGQVLLGSIDGGDNGVVVSASSTVAASVKNARGAGIVVAGSDIDVDVVGEVEDNDTGVLCLGGRLTAPTRIRGNAVGVDVRGACLAALDDIVLEENGIACRVQDLAAEAVGDPPQITLGVDGPALVVDNGTPVVINGGSFVLGDDASFVGNDGLAIDRGGDGRSPNRGRETDAPIITRITTDGVTSVVSGFVSAGVTVRFWSADVTTSEPQPQTFLLERTEGSALDLDVGVGDYSDPVFGDVTGQNRFSFRIPTSLVGGLLIAIGQGDFGTTEPGNAFGLDPCLPNRASPTCDRDADGLTNEEERALGTNELLADSDGDHISDFDEGAGDEDGDGVIDANDSNLVDDDGDGLTGVADVNDRNPCFPDDSVGSCDRDRDGLSNAEEAALGTSPDLADSDEDGISDGAEARFDTDADGINNGLESNNTDLDSDGEFDDVDPIELPPECAVAGQTLRETVVLDEAQDVVDFEASGVACVIGYLIIGDDVGPVNLTQLQVVTGRVIVRESFGASVTLAALTRAGSLEVEENTALTALSLPVLTLIDTDLRIVSNPVLSNLDIRALRKVGGSVVITNNGALVTLALPNLESIGGDFTVSDNDALVNLELNTLIQIDGDLVISNNDELVTVDLPTLSGVGGDLIVEDNAALPTLDLPELDTVGGDLVISDNDALESVTAPTLASVGGDLRIEENDGLSTVGLPGLANVGGDLVIDPIAEGGTVDVGSLDEVGGDVRIDTTATVTIPPGWVCDGGTCAEPCGDGVISAGEVCDDGDGDDGDGCSARCAIEPGFLCAAGENGTSLCLPVGALVNEDPPVVKEGCNASSTTTSMTLVALLLLLRRRRR